MDNLSQNIFAAIILVTIVFVLFFISVILRIKNALYELRRKKEITKQYMVYKRLDILFSCIFLCGMILVYLVFILNIGR